MKHSLAGLTLILCLGVFIATKAKIPFLCVYCLAIIFLTFSFLAIKKRLRFDIFLFFLIFFLGIALLKNSQILPKCHIAKYTSYRNNSLHIVRGIIVSQPLLKINKTSFIFESREIQSDNLRHNCCGNIIVYMRGKKDLNYGDELILQGNLHRPFSFGILKRQSYRDYLYNQGIFSIMHVKAETPVVRLNKNRGFALKRLALWLKQKMEEIIFKRASFITASIFDAMVLGEKRNIPALIYNSMIKSGTVHILVVSGFNVGIVTFIIVLFLKLIRIPRKIRICIAIPLFILYCLVTGASNPVMRATIMAIVFMSAYLVKREPDIYNSFAIAIMFILAINPRQLFDIGFQLSFISVFSIVYLYPKIKSLIRINALKIKYIIFLVDSCLVSFSAWLGTMGLIACYFKIFSPVTVLANLFIVPLAALITLCGFSLIIMELILPVLSPFFAYSSELLVAFLLNINALLIKLPGAYFYLS
jgi:competence protein ComEC